MVGGSVSLQLDSLVRMVGCISATTASFLVLCSLLKSCTISSKQDDPDCNLQCYCTVVGKGHKEDLLNLVSLFFSLLCHYSKSTCFFQSFVHKRSADCIPIQNDACLSFCYREFGFSCHFYAWTSPFNHTSSLALT